MSRGSTRHVVLPALLVGVVALVVLPTAAATFGGVNGTVAFTSYRTCPVVATGPCADFEEIYSVEPNGHGLERLTTAFGSDRQPKWSPDGQLIAFVSDRDTSPADRAADRRNSEIYIMNANGSDQRRVTFFEGPDASPVWLPDGSRVAFVRFNGFSQDLYTVDVASGAETLMASSFVGSEPDLSPDGQTLAFARQSEIFTSPYPTGPLTQLTTSSNLFDGSPSWAPDGTRIAWTCQIPVSVNVCVMNRDGSGFASLTTDGTDGNRNLDPVWAPEGNAVAFIRELHSVPTLAVMRSDGTRIRTISSGYDEFPDWQPRLGH